MTKTTVFVVCLCLAASALAPPATAQTPTAPGSAATPAPDEAPPGPAGRERAIMGGKNIQPRSVPGQAGQSPEAQIRLLQKGSKDLPPSEPIVVPHDIYGNPLGGNPGLNPPGLEPPPSSEAPAAPKPHPKS